MKASILEKFARLNCQLEFIASKQHKGQFGSSWGMTGTRKGKRPDLDNKYFRSSWEANYARYLNWLIKQHQIKCWEYESVTFEFKSIKKGTRFFTPDFKVTLLNDKVEYHEVKGWNHPKGNTALKRMAKYYPDIPIVLIDAKVYKSLAKQIHQLIPNWELNGKQSY